MDNCKEIKKIKKSILTMLDGHYPTPIAYQDHKLFNTERILSEVFNRKMRLTDIAFTELKADGFIEFTSELERLPRRGLVLTPQGRERYRGFVREYQEHGFKAAISAAFNVVGGIIKDRFPPNN